MHIEVITAKVTAPGAGGAAAAAVTGDSLTIKNAKSQVQLLAAWVDSQGTGYLQLVRPSGHDTTRDIRVRHFPGEVRPLLPLGMPVFVEPQETLAITQSGSATAGDVESICLLMAYKDLPGVDQKLMRWSEVRSRIEEMVTLDCSITAAGNGVGYSGDELITAESNILKARTDYAVLGAVPAVECGAITLYGPDTSYVRVAIPGCDNDPQMTGGWFGLLSRANNDMPTIPVINSGNRDSTYIGCTQDENNTAVPVSLILAKLKG